MFKFGQNWKDYALNALDESKLRQAQQALENLLQPHTVLGKTFMDIGCGSGLHTVSAVLLGAKQVYALDIDPDCIEVTEYTISRFLKSDTPIHLQLASILNADTLQSLPQVDIVYSWGVLHHTGHMYPAIDAASQFVKAGGLFVIAIYNKHITSPVWHIIKRFYNQSPPIMRRPMYALFYGLIYIAKLTATRQNPLKKERGMDFGYDVIDWIGGYPYQYASIDNIIAFVTGRGFTIEKIVPAQIGTGCNEFVFRKNEP
jgi:SAM-dependent methyltransferase